MKQFEYRIEGKHHDDITGEYLDRVLEDFYVMHKDKGFASLPDGIKWIEKTVH